MATVGSARASAAVPGRDPAEEALSSRRLAALQLREARVDDVDEDALEEGATHGSARAISGRGTLVLQTEYSEPSQAGSSDTASL